MDLKISELTAATSIATSDLLTIVQGGTNKKITFANFLASIADDPITSPLYVTGGEGLDSVLHLWADDGDDDADKWSLTSSASTNSLLFKNNTTTVLTITSAGASSFVSTLQAAGITSTAGITATTTIVSPTIGPAGGQQHTLPAVTSDTIALLAAAQTLTNKTISGSTNTLSNIANASLTNSAITINGTSTSLGGTRTLTLASSDFANQGTTTTVLFGNAAGNPSWGTVVSSATGTSNQVNVSAASGAVTFSLPQSIDTAATLQFNKLGLGTSTFGDSATNTLALFLGTAPSTSPADTLQIFASNAPVSGDVTLGLRTEHAVGADAAVASTHSLPISINGTVYRLLLATV